MIYLYIVLLYCIPPICIGIYSDYKNIHLNENEVIMIFFWPIMIVLFIIFQITLFPYKLGKIIRSVVRRNKGE